MQNLIEYLKNFNSKERFFLVGQALGNPSFTLAPEFREKLGGKLEIPIPADALSAMDYHIDWLYASLRLATDDDPARVYSNSNNMIKAQQEDIDWLIAFNSGNKYHLVLIEVKGVTGWTNKQLTSKATRFSEIFGEQGNTWLGVMPHFVIMSPLQPKRLSVGKWPQWMAPSGQVRWLELSVPDNLSRVHRCDARGKENKSGQYWKVTTR